MAKPHPEPTVEAVSRSAWVHPEYARVSAPALAFFVLYDAAYVTPQMGDRARGTSELAFRVLDASGYKREQIDLFRKTVMHGRVIEWHDTNHMITHAASARRRPSISRADLRWTPIGRHRHPSLEK